MNFIVRLSSFYVAVSEIGFSVVRLIDTLTAK